LCGIGVDNITGVAGDLMVKYLHTNYSEEQKGKFPHSIFKFYNLLLSFGTFKIY